MRLLVFGGRDFGAHFVPPGNSKASALARARNLKERYIVYNWIAKALEWESTEDIATWLPPPDTVVITGGCPTSADNIAIDWAVVHWVKFETYPADWDQHGRAAGPIRNQEMIDAGKPDTALGFPGGRGTADMRRRVLVAGIRLVEYTA
jgi:hypothetical protein